MKSFFFFFLFLCASFVQANNDIHGHKDPNEIRIVKDNKRSIDVQYQYLLRNQPNWQNFLLENGTWYVHFNQTNGKPHKAFGKPISVQGATPVQQAENFINQKLSGFGIPTEELEFLTMTTNDHFNHVFFTQRHEGKKVLFTRLSVKLTLDGKVIGFSADVYDHLDVEASSISDAEALSAATENLEGDVTSIEGNSELMILPVPEYDRKRTVFRPVYEVMVKTLDENRIPGHYLTYVDAVTADVILRKNMVSHCESEPPGGTTVSVTDDLSLTNPSDPETNSPLANLEITQGGNTLYTDGDGQAVGLALGNATFQLRGLWSEVFTNGTTPSFTVNLTNGVNAVDFGINANSRESSAFYHVNIVHDYMKSYFPSFTSMDNALETNVDVSGTCNAFYNGSSINFYQAGAGCNSYALVGDVVYHEYGHGINDKYYQSQGAVWMNGAMGEGYADIWGLGITESPILGLGNSQSLPDDFVRRYDMDPKIYPQDLIGEVHADGEIIAGAWWDLGQNFGDIQQMIRLFADTYDAVVTGYDGNEGEVFVDILIEALQVDDAPSNGGDNDITNGTPNDLDIINAFDAHGITLLSNASLDHDPIQAHDDQEIEVDITVVNDYPWAMNDAIAVYRINSSMSWNTVSLSNIGGNVYSASIPAQPNGTVVAYYVALENLNNTLANVEPVAANLAEPNVPHYILVGYDLNRIADFDNYEYGDWVEGLPSDNNSSGTWVIDMPTGSFSDDGVMVQTDANHTPGENNIACAVTGNASTNAGIGENDVDGGHTTLMTPVFDLSEFTDPAISFWRYYTNSPPSGANPGADWWQVLITDDGTDWVYVENTKVSDPSWRRVAVRVSDYVDVTDNIQMKFIASDSTHVGQNLDGGSLVEGALDDLEIWEIAGGAQSGIDDTEISALSIYPNPTSGDVSITLTLESNTALHIELFNTLGAKVFEQHQGAMQVGNHTFKMNLGQLNSGIYHLKVSSELGNTVKRLELLK